MTRNETPYIVSCPRCGRGWTMADRPYAEICPACLAKQEAALETLQQDLQRRNAADKRREELSWCANEHGGGCACRALCLLLVLFLFPALACLLASQVLVDERDLAVPPKLRTAVTVIEALPDTVEVLVDASTIEAITPYTVPGLGEITSGTHATEKHQQNALAARLMLGMDGTQCRECSDGRWRCWNGYAFGVYETIKDGILEITVFVADYDPILKLNQDCPATP